MLLDEPDDLPRPRAPGRRPGPVARPQPQPGDDRRHGPARPQSGGPLRRPRRCPARRPSRRQRRRRPTSSTRSSWRRSSASAAVSSPTPSPARRSSCPPPPTTRAEPPRDHHRRQPRPAPDRRRPTGRATQSVLRPDPSGRQRFRAPRPRGAHARPTRQAAHPVAEAAGAERAPRPRRVVCRVARAAGGRPWSPAHLHGPRRGEGDDRQLVVDFVLHGHGPLGAANPLGAGGAAAGPAGTWAARAAVGDEVGLLAPAPRSRTRFGGIEFDPGAAGATAPRRRRGPACARVHRRVPAGLAPGAWPSWRCRTPATDFLDVRFPAGIERHWIARGARPGRADPRRAARAPGPAPGGRAVADASVPGPIDRPRRRRVGRPRPTAPRGQRREHAAGARPRPGDRDTYAWVAGDSDTVKACRRLLVGEGGIPRPQVAFMGYWKQGRSG